MYELNDLLENDDRYKLSLLNYFEAVGSEQLIQINNLGDLLGISKYRVVNYITELNKELLLNELSSRIDIYENKEIRITELNREHIRILRLFYLERSTTFLIFKEALSKVQSIEEFADRHFMSLSAAYARNKQLILFLKPLGIKLKKGKLVGREEIIRRLIFEVLFQFYNGIKDPFEENIMNSREVAKKIGEGLNLSCSPIQEIKIYLFIGIQNLRVRNDFLLTSGNETEISQFREDFIWIKQYLNKIYHNLTDKELRREVISINQYLELQGLLECEDIWDELGNEQAVQMTNSFVHGLEGHLVNYLTSDDQEKKEYFIHLGKELKVINMRFISGYGHAETFPFQRQVKFFEETYPLYHDYIIKYFEQNSNFNQFEFTKSEKIALYYEYMFTINVCIPASEVNDAIHICVDFSSGKNYSRYIANNIKSFKDLNIIVEERLSSQTDIYMSDFVVTKIKCRQIIWLNPPTNKDWENFGNLVVEFKRLKVKNENN
ncbi:helix-turn-helix domain-containing protein [Dellaglioa algida]|uniref:helix-turn-helix domain-containing protein n=1 Tax=Dellaglioa algida TaxID=105612 RepID=UPI0024C4C74F|nr:helix-turn-helix domain-containing protein [Dellaglioa algida]MDK1728437.1 helix-turn-helix domain-containing protein [Dellaglioa algida]MDK1736159.1 helix-turn-helix domain-containing protein [Dellaglioa algida]MDK1737802.1 helix-turn-helix domain-containing protein [Dellaglioa algida]